MLITGKQIKDGTITGSKLSGSLSSQAPIVIDKDLVTSPGAGSAGDKYIIAGIGGFWSPGTIGDIAEDLDGGGTSWDFVTPSAGFEAWVEDEEASYRFDGSNWLYELGTAAAGTTLKTDLLTVEGDGITLSDGGIFSNAANINAAQVTIDPSISGGGTDGNLLISDVVGAAVDERIYSLKNDEGTLRLETFNDSFVGTDILTITRTGAVVDAITLLTPLTSLESVEPTLRLVNTGAATDEKMWLIDALSDTLSISTADDAGSQQDEVIQVERVGHVAESITFGPNDELIVAFNQVDDTEHVLALSNQGSNGATSKTFVGNQDPTGNGVGAEGDHYRRSDGVNSLVYIHDGSDWFIPSGGLLQSDFTDLAVDTTTTASSFPGSTLLTTTITKKLASSALIVHFSVGTSNSNNGRQNFFRLVVDGVVQRGVGVELPTSSESSAASLLARVAGVSAGSRIISIQWYRSSNTGQVRPVAAPDSEHASLLVEEVLI